MAKKKKQQNNTTIIIVAVIIVVVLVALFIILWKTGTLDNLIPAPGDDSPSQEASTPADQSSSTPSGGNTSGQAVRAASVGTIDGTPIDIHFLNVGQGDAILLDLPDDKCMLIDGGTTQNPPSPTKSGKETLQEGLASVTKNGVIDYMIVTHSDTDHFSLLSKVLDDYEVKNIYFNDLDENSPVYTKTYYNFTQKAKAEEGANIVAIDTPDDRTFTFTVAACSFTIFSPGNDGFTKQSARIKNGMSLLTLLEYGGRKILFMGDATDEEEEWFIAYTEAYDMDVDFLKVAHHGSSSSNTTAFLNYVKAEYGVLSAGDYSNRYGLPADDALQRLQQANVTYYRTDENGTILLTVDSDGDYAFSFEKEKE